MKANTVITSSGAEVYLSNIYEEADRYIAALDAEDDEERKKLMRRPAIFRGMLKTIYLNLFKKEPGESRLNNRGSKVNYDNLEILDGLWDTYALLCYRYNQTPNLLGFGLMTGVSRNTIGDWSRGKYNSSSERICTIQKWKEESEGALYDSAATGNPGAMFLLKCCHSYSEQGGISQHDEVVLNNIESPQRIASRHIGEKPELPDLS